MYLETETDLVSGYVVKSITESENAAIILHLRLLHIKW